MKYSNKECCYITNELSPNHREVPPIMTFSQFTSKDLIKPCHVVTVLLNDLIDEDLEVRVYDDSAGDCWEVYVEGCGLGGLGFNVSRSQGKALMFYELKDICEYVKSKNLK